MKRLIKISGLIVLLLLVLTCKKHDDTPGPDEIVIAEKVDVIKSDTWKDKFISMDSANYTLIFSKDMASGFNVGDIIVSAAGEGLLRKITSVQTSNSVATVHTESAALTDVVQQGLLEYDQPLTMAQVTSIDYSYAGMELKNAASKGTDQSQFGWDINVVLYDRDNDKTTTNDQIKLTGNLNCDWRLAFKIDIGFLSNLKEVKFSFVSTENLDLELIAGVEYELEKEITLATINFSPITIFAGPVPVVFTPQLKIKVGIDGSASASVTTGISQSMSFEAGLQYLKERGWAPYNSFTKNLEFNPPQLNMNASAEGYLKPEMLIKVYGVGGPYANLKLYSRLDADISQTPWWKLYGGISMSAGAKVNIINKYVLEYTVSDLIKYEQILAQASSPHVSVPTLTSVAASSITRTSAASGGNISSDGGGEVTARGVCWSTSENPTTDLTTKTSNGTGTGPFTSSLTGLTPETMYYIRAYATNSAGTAYGQQVSFTTDPLVKPVLTTAEASEITQTTATSGGDISSDGGSQVTDRGICWSTDENPTTDLITKISNGTGTGSFTGNLTGLTPGTRYYIRAYATNSLGTSYGQQVSFNALATVTDIQGNIYKVVKIGNQTWMAENLRYLPSVSGSESGSKTVPYYYVYGYNGTDVNEAKATNNYTTYGVLYNWPAAMNGAASSQASPSGVQGVCPTGWHLPSMAELSELETYLGGYTVAGGKLKEVGLSHWIAPNEGATDEVGFKALPGGYRFPNSVFSVLGEWGYLWSTSEVDTEIASGRQINNASGEFFGYVYYKDWGFSVRCVKN